MIKELRNQLKAKEHSVETLQEQLEKLKRETEKAEGRKQEGDGGSDASTKDLENQIKAKEHIINTLRAQLDEEGEPSSERKEKEGGRDPQIQQLKNDLKAKEHTINGLRDQLERVEAELGSARTKLMDEVKKLSALTSGEVELKPAKELDLMEADELLDYADDVARDLDVRRQTLEHGLEGIDSLRNNYEESKKVYDEQQRAMSE